jgi:hypothetical protein
VDRRESLTAPDRDGSRSAPADRRGTDPTRTVRPLADAENSENRDERTV